MLDTDEADVMDEEILKRHMKKQRNDTLQLKYLEIVVDMQVNLLRNLRSFLQSANSNLTQEVRENTGFMLNLRKIPVLTQDGTAEELIPVLAVVENLVEERMEVKGALEGLRHRIMKVMCSQYFPLLCPMAMI